MVVRKLPRGTGVRRNQDSPDQAGQSGAGESWQPPGEDSESQASGKDSGGQEGKQASGKDAGGHEDKQASGKDAGGQDDKQASGKDAGGQEGKQASGKDAGKKAKPKQASQEDSWFPQDQQNAGQQEADQEQDGGGGWNPPVEIGGQSGHKSGFGAYAQSSAAAEVIAQLHQAKTELAKELEANLKQLKAVLQETERISKDMEAVLQETKAQAGDQQAEKDPPKEKQACSSDSAPDDQRRQDEAKVAGPGKKHSSAWQPPLWNDGGWQPPDSMGNQWQDFR